MYQIQLDVFEGPFDLLLDLILKQELDIYEIPIAKITDDYLKYLARMEKLDLEIATEFLVMAATLIELKSAALLPTDEEGYLEEEAKAEIAARESLAEHLIEYKRFKGVAEELEQRMEVESRLFWREAELEDEFADLRPDYLEGVRLADLAFLAQTLLKPEPDVKIDTSHITSLKLSLAEKAEEILFKLKKVPRQTFRKLCAEARDKIEIIVTFLALLELFKRGLIYLSQTRTFGEIKVELKKDTKGVKVNA